MRTRDESIQLLINFALKYLEEYQKENENDSQLENNRKKARNTEENIFAFDNFCSDNSLDDSKSKFIKDIHAYFSIEYPYDSDNSSIFLHWSCLSQVNHAMFILNKIVRKIFITTASSVPSEAAFSKSGLLLTPLRQKMKDKTIENVMTVADWTRFDTLCKDLNIKGINKY